MLAQIGTDDLKFHSDRLSPSTHPAPGIARNVQRIHRIGDDCPPDAKVIFGDRVGDSIACLIEPCVVRGAISDRLLNGVDPQVRRADLTRQLASDGCLPGPWQAAKYD
jgi:hypothetical protein